MTSATCGLRGHLSSPSASLQSSLESRLRRRLDGAGSTLFSLIWRRRGTPAGRPYYQLAASVLRTSDSGFGSWQMPMANEKPRTERFGKGRSPNAVEALAGWPTPDASMVQDGETFETWEARRLATKARVGNGNGFGTPLTIAAQMTGWPTATKADAHGSRRHGYMLKGHPGTTLTDAANLVAGWATPTQRDHKDGGSDGTVPINGLLGRQVWQTSWPTPCQQDGPNGGPSQGIDRLPGAAGLIATGSPAATAKPGQLNPAFTRWLMGYPPEWDACAPTATRSSRHLPPSS